MQNFFQRIKKDMIFSAVLQMLSGALLIIYSDRFLDILCRGIGILLLAYGGFKLLRYFMRKEPDGENRYELIQGIFCIGAGLFVMLAVKLIVDIMIILFGILIVFESVLKIQDALDLRKLGHGSWIFMLIVAIAMAAAGCMMIVKPSGLVSFLFTFAGIVLLCNAVLNLWDILFISRKLKKG